jgi:hypothetical protein
MLCSSNFRTVLPTHYFSSFTSLRNFVRMYRDESLLAIAAYPPCLLLLILLLLILKAQNEVPALFRHLRHTKSALLQQRHRRQRAIRISLQLLQTD